jgi:hypothetical protein
MGKLGQLLVARGWITVQQLTRALQTQNSVGGRVGTCLLEMEVLGEDLLARSLSEQLGVPAAVIEDLRGIPDEVLRLIPEKLARRCRAIPFRVAGGRLDIAMQDPRNLVCQDEIAFACGRRVKVHVLHELRIYEALQRYYREECPSRYALLLDRLNRARYLWGAKEGGPRPPPGTPVAQVAQRAAGAPPRPGTPAAGRAGGPPGALAANPYSAEIRAEVLSALPAEGLLAETPRFQPPPLPEPSLPPLPRRRSLFRSRGSTATAAAKAPPAAAGESPREAPAMAADGAAELLAMPVLQPGAAAGGASTGPGGAQVLPPLEELDLRGEPPRRQQRQDGAAEAAAGAAPAAGAAGVVVASVASDVAGATAATDATDVAQAPAGAADGDATPDAGPAGTIPGLDLEATLALGPPAVGRPRGPAAVSAPREAPAPLGAAAPRREPAAVPHEKVAITEEERAELGLGEAPPAAAAESPREAPVTPEEVERALAATADIEEVGRLLLGFLAHSFRRVALFQASRDRVTAWMARGDDIDQEAFARYAVSFDQPSVFLNLRQGSGIHIGPLPPMTTHRELALCWGGGLPRDCVMLPVRLRDRLVTVVYMDGGSRGLGGIDLEQMHRLTAAAAAAFERCILSKKRGYAQS